MWGSLGGRVTQHLPCGELWPCLWICAGEHRAHQYPSIHCRSRACEHPSHAKQPSQSPLTHQSSSVSIHLSTHLSIHPSVCLSIHPLMVRHSLGLQAQTFQAKHSAPPGCTHLRIMVFRERGQGLSGWDTRPPCPPRTGGIMSRAARSQPRPRY
uniref:Uncharacterized protein n=1 Tax=Myotis myotis TaxID=51298 RepID=A0A7J7TTR3_MYOMY|nr:hypothetical protein mMyoMyo1_008960 [Myotis myotis]